MRGAKILGTGRALPKRVVTNADLMERMDTTEEWIVQRTGVRERRFVDPGTGTADLGTEAARAAVARAGIPSPTSISSYSPPSRRITSSRGRGVRPEKLGLPTIGALDVRTQCTGFLYGLSVAEAYVKGGFYNHILVIGSEVQSTGLDMSTAGRDVSVIFGDGAGAVVVGPARPGKGILSSHLHAEGKYAKELMCEAPSSIEHPRLSHEMLTAGRHWPRMNGRYVFTHAVRRFPEVIRESLAANGMSIADLSLVIPHQANLRITQAVAGALNVPEELVYSNIERYGNTTAASIPIALDECVEQEESGRDLVCLAAFGQVHRRRR
jgi:3-oxoacyl-[acyl-carrier-protein] synthase-3